MSLCDSSVQRRRAASTSLARLARYAAPACSLWLVASTDLIRVLLEEGHRHGVGADAQGQLLFTGEYNELTAMETVIERSMMDREDYLNDFNFLRFLVTF